MKFPRGRMPKETKAVLEDPENDVTKERLVCPRHGLWLKEFPDGTLENGKCQGCLDEEMLDSVMPDQRFMM